jgi:hypothetical protein
MDMNTRGIAIAMVVAASFTAPFLLAQGAAPAAPAPGAQGGGRAGAPKKAPPPMSFFVTSTSLGKGGNLGGLQGADAHCQALGTAAGSSKTWRAYLSTQGPNAVNARDRIGRGPWANAKGMVVAASVEELHGDTIELARLGNRITKTTALNEKGELISGAGDTPNQHDIITGTQPDGRAFPPEPDRTCANYTSETTGNVMLGHNDRTGGPNPSWNAVHASAGCTQAQLIQTGGNGYLYCFAID